MGNVTQHHAYINTKGANRNEKAKVFVHHFLTFLQFLTLAICLRANCCFAQSQNAPVQALPQADVHMKWQYGADITGGFVPSYRISDPQLSFEERLNFFSGSLEAGKNIGHTREDGIGRGHFEMLANFSPLWWAHYPEQTRIYKYANGQPSDTSLIKAYSVYGVSVTPLLARWNLDLRSRPTIVPWVQLGGGLLWTNQKFPLFGGSTSDLNFTPQVGVGTNIFFRKRQSVDVALKIIHISNAGLGDTNPGLNQTVQFSVGYSWWK